MARTDTHILLEDTRKTATYLIVEADDPRITEPYFRTVSSLSRDRGYQGIVFKDKWGGVWRQSEEATNISDAMEKWA